MAYASCSRKPFIDALPWFARLPHLSDARSLRQRWVIGLLTQIVNPPMGQIAEILELGGLYAAASN
jgi:hypothetical protein